MKFRFAAILTLAVLAVGMMGCRHHYYTRPVQYTGTSTHVVSRPAATPATFAYTDPNTGIVYYAYTDTATGVAYYYAYRDPNTGEIQYYPRGTHRVYQTSPSYPSYPASGTTTYHYYESRPVYVPSYRRPSTYHRYPTYYQRPPTYTRPRSYDRHHDYDRRRPSPPPTTTHHKPKVVKLPVPKLPVPKKLPVPDPIKPLKDLGNLIKKVTK